MRIPVTKADWPNSFNATAKYIGRHWPAGKLKLSDAREKTSKMFGYNSVHDVQQELLESIPQSYYSVSTMASSAAVKAVLYFGLSPLESHRFFSSIPWTNLDVWESTSEYILQQHEGFGKRLLLDEYHSFINYTTPALIAGAFSKGKIPHFEFTVNHDGTMFHRGSFERLLELVQPDEVTIKECGLEIGVEQYFEEKILPLAFGKIEDLIPRLHPEEPEYWLKPDHVEVVRSSDGRYLLSNNLLNAFYPGDYAADELVFAIKKLFMLKIISDVETNSKMPTVLQYDSHTRYEPFGLHGSFKFNGQSFFSRSKLNDYTKFVNTPFLDYLTQQLKPAPSLNIPEAIIPSSQLAAINKAIKIETGLMASKSNGVAALLELGIIPVFSELYGETFYSDDALAEEHPFDRFIDDEDQAEITKELNTYSSFCVSLGAGVLKLMPELKPFYSAKVIGHYFHLRYQDSDDDRPTADSLTTKAALQDDFILSLLSDHLCKELSEHLLGVAFKGVGWLLSAANANIISISDIKIEFGRLMTLVHLIKGERELVKKIATYCNLSPIAQKDDYINYGSAYKPTVKRLSDGFEEHFRIGRKLGGTPMLVEQQLNRS